MYFDSVDYYKEVVVFFVYGIGLDFVYDWGENFMVFNKYGFLIDKVLVVGVIDGWNIWCENLDE